MVLAASLAEILVGGFRHWAQTHAVVTAFGTGIGVIAFTAVVVDGLARERDRKLTDGYVIKAIEELASTGLWCAPRLTTDYISARDSNTSLSALAGSPGGATEEYWAEALFQAFQRSLADCSTSLAYAARWRFVEYREEMLPVFEAYRPIGTRVRELEGTFRQKSSDVTQREWNSAQLRVKLLVSSGLEMAQLAQEARDDDLARGSIDLKLKLWLDEDDKRYITALENAASQLG